MKRGLYWEFRGLLSSLILTCLGSLHQGFGHFPATNSRNLDFRSALLGPKDVQT